MDRDDFIIAVYCLVCEHYASIRAAYGVRHGGVCSRADRRRGYHHGALWRVL